MVVVLSNKASTSLRTYTTADFEGIGCTKVQNLTQYTTAQVNAKLRGETAELQKTTEPDVITFAEFKKVDTEKFHQILCLTLDKASKQNVLDVINILMKHPDVLSAEPDYVIKAASAPSDTYYADQWAINKISLPAAWNYTTGSSTVRVGVIDSGIDGDHPELINKINYQLSRDYIPGQDITPNSVYDVIDETGHGTQVAGIIGAAVNNGQGISGVCHNVELISLRVLDDRDEGYTTRFCQAIDHAKVNNIPILNMSISWLSNLYTETDNASFAASLVQYGGLLICAAGNHTRNIDAKADTVIYPGIIGYDKLIIVGASTNTDTKVGNSNWGAESVDLFAPGFGIYTCHPQGLSAGTATYISNGYVSTGATSMAVPHVTGVAAMILAKYPTLSAMQIKERIMESVDPVSAFSGICVTGGRLNAYKAVHPHNFFDNSNTTHHSDACLCGVIRNKGLHTYEQVGPRLYRCTECGYENEWLP